MRRGQGATYVCLSPSAKEKVTSAARKDGQDRRSAIRGGSARVVAMDDACAAERE